MYNKDTRKYGDPADSGAHVHLATELDEWQLVVQKHAEKIEPPATEADEGDEEGEDGPPKKRARVTTKASSVDPSLTAPSASASTAE